MEKRKLERVFRGRRLTQDESAREKAIRRKIEQEFPPARPAAPAGPRSLSDTLRSAIRASGRSVYQIAKQSGVSPIVISRFLSGERDIRMATADKLAEALGLTLPAP